MREAKYTTSYLTPEDLKREGARQVRMPSGKRERSLKILGADGRGWQLKCYRRLCKGKKRFSYFIAFMGSGKSLVMKYLATYDLVTSGGTQKQVILVPLTSLDKGFTSSPVRVLGKVYQWELKPGRNLCDPKSKNVIADLKKALVEPLDAYQEHWEKNSLYGRIIVTTDQALVEAWNEMTEEQKELATGNSSQFGITYNKDEAHRVLMPAKSKQLDDDEDEDGNSGNELGKIFDRVTKSRRGGLRMASGTFLRGDYRETILGDASHLFADAAFEQDFIEHYNTLGIKKFSLNTHIYKNSPGVPELFDFIREIATQFKSRGVKWMLMLPHRDKGFRAWFYKNTNFGADLIFDILREVGYEDSRVLNFVDANERDKNRPTLDAEPQDGEHDKPSRVDVVVGVNSLSMGVDWPECASVVNTVNDHSIINLLQKPGRAFRKFHGKTFIEIYSCIPEFELKDGLEYQEVMSDYTNQIMAHFFMSDMFDPIQFTGANGVKIRLRDYWREGGKYAEVCRRILEVWNVMENGAHGEKEARISDLRTEVESIIKEYDTTFPPKELRIVANAFIERTIRSKNRQLPKSKPSGGHEPTSPRNTVDASFIRENGCDLVVEDNTKLRDIGLYAADNLTDAELTQVRDILRTRWQWDIMYGHASKVFGRNPRIRKYVVGHVLSGQPIEWRLLDVSDETNDAIRWAVAHHGRLSELKERQAKKIKELFKPEPVEVFKPTPPTEPVVRRRPSFGRKLVVK